MISSEEEIQEKTIGCFLSENITLKFHHHAKINNNQIYE